MRKLAAALGTDSSSLCRHFRNKTELLRTVAGRVLMAAVDDCRPGATGDSASPPWPRACERHSAAFGRPPRLAAIWARCASSGTGSRLVMEEVPQGLRASGLPEEEVSVRHHRISILLAPPSASEAGSAPSPPRRTNRGWDSSAARY
ncbi:hypothetical protein AV521_44770 [Streptomyces sp. IMTB 2501]|nr:hypothetical protein AV521_44770 [Streptomyces sp. IMTB 2501]